MPTTGKTREAGVRSTAAAWPRTRKASGGTGRSRSIPGGSPWLRRDHARLRRRSPPLLYRAGTGTPSRSLARMAATRPVFAERNLRQPFRAAGDPCSHLFFSHYTPGGKRSGNSGTAPLVIRAETTGFQIHPQRGANASVAGGDIYAI